MIAQSDKQYNANAGNSIINVTGGTFKGGYNCYGNAVGDAQINIKGGNFNADPTQYVEEGYNAVEENGLWNINDSQIYSEDALIEALNNGSDIILGSDITLTKNWTPIGTIDAPYNAVFNGKNHKIIGLKVDNTEYAAFIAYAGKDAVIKNLNLVNVELNSTKHAAGVVCIASEGVTLENMLVGGMNTNCKSWMYVISRGKSGGASINDLHIAVVETDVEDFLADDEKEFFVLYTGDKYETTEDYELVFENEAGVILKKIHNAE